MQYLVGAIDLHLAEYVGVAEDEFVTEFVTNVLDVECVGL